MYKFKPGDCVIKTTGGNKMKIIGYTMSGIDCAWVSDTYNEKTFLEEELIPINEYNSIMITHKREDYINQIIN